jgi:DNA-binding Xre family transcriptional regulator
MRKLAVIVGDVTKVLNSSELLKFAQVHESTISRIKTDKFKGSKLNTSEKINAGLKVVISELEKYHLELNHIIETSRNQENELKNI